jgi:hypothetical protein
VSNFEDRMWWAVRPHWAWRMLRLALRCFWIAAAVAGVGFLAGQSSGWRVPFVAWLAGGYALFMLLLAIVALWPISPRGVARRLDLAFRLSDRLATAYEIAQRQPRNYLEQRLLETSHQLLGGVRRRLERQPRVPWLDLEMGALALLSLYACYLLAGPLAPAAPDIPPAAYNPPAPLLAEVEVPLPGAPPDLNGGASSAAGDDAAPGAGI